MSKPAYSIRITRRDRWGSYKVCMKYGRGQPIYVGIIWKNGWGNWSWTCHKPVLGPVSGYGSRKLAARDMLRFYRSEKGIAGRAAQKAWLEQHPI